MTIICPNCGYHHAEKPYAPELLHLIFDLPLKQKDALVRLMDARGGFVSNEQLIDQLWGDRTDGGPDSARQDIMTYMSRLRRKVEPLGWSIPGRKFEGYRLIKVAP